MSEYQIRDRAVKPVAKKGERLYLTITDDYKEIIL
jgi:hypothetical protein